MYSSRKTTVSHGTHQLSLLLINIAVAVVLTLLKGRDYLVIFLASGLLHTFMEIGLGLTGGRKSDVYVYGHKLPKIPNAVLRAFVEGPGPCVPAYFAADHLISGDYAIGIVVPILLMTGAATYSAVSDRIALKRLETDEDIKWSRREMTRPGVMMPIAFISSTCLAVLLLMSEPHRGHALLYVLSYSLLIMLFFLINYRVGVRMIQRYDYERGEFYTPGIGFQLVAYTYDSVYEMGLLLSPIYLIPFGLGLLQYVTMAG